MYSYNPDEKLAMNLAKMSKKELNYVIRSSNKIIKKARTNYNKQKKENEKMKKEDRI